MDGDNCVYCDADNSCSKKQGKGFQLDARVIIGIGSNVKYQVSRVTASLKYGIFIYNIYLYILSISA